MDNQNDDSNPVGGAGSHSELTLRQQAEAKVQVWEELQQEVFDPKKCGRLVHELRVHQIELELQNEELRQFQQQLEISQGRYRDLYDFAPVGYVTVSQAGLVLEANRTAATLLRVAVDTLVGQPISRFILFDDQDIYYHHRMAVFEAAEPQTCRLRLLRNGHAPFWARLETAPGRNCGLGPSVCCRIMFSDIHEGMLAAVEKAELEGKYRQLQKAESLGLMAGAIAHHFNNLLGVVSGNLELAMDELPKDSAAGEHVDAAMAASERAAEVSGSMLTYLGHSLGKRQSLDLAETCRASLAGIRATVPKEVDLVVELPENGGPIINANAHQLQQVLKNMVTNSWEAGGGGGQRTVRLTVKTVAPADIPETHRFPLEWRVEEGLYACLEVTDNGCGIDPPEIEKLFDPFFTSKFLGRGLGLPIVLGIVRGHGGVVTVASEVGRSSVFSVFLPVDVKGVCRPLKPAIQSPVITEGGTVLIAEDDPMLCEIAEAMLNRLGYEVLIAKDGFEAVEIFKQHRDAIRCVLCDLVMPRMDGWETLSALRRLAPDLPVVLSSGYDQVQVMAGDHSDWPQIFLGKPYNLAGLRAAIHQALAGGGNDQPEGCRERHPINDQPGSTGPLSVPPCGIKI